MVERGIALRDGTMVTPGNKVAVHKAARARVADNWTKQIKTPTVGRNEARSLVKENLIVARVGTTEITVYPESDPKLEFSVPAVDIHKVELGLR